MARDIWLADTKVSAGSFNRFLLFSRTQSKQSVCCRRRKAMLLSRCRSADHDSQQSTPIPRAVEELDIDAAGQEISVSPIGIVILRRRSTNLRSERLSSWICQNCCRFAENEESLVKKATALSVLLSPFFFWGTSMVAMKVCYLFHKYHIRSPKCLMSLDCIAYRAKVLK